MEMHLIFTTLQPGITHKGIGIVSLVDHLVGIEQSGAPAHATDDRILLEP